MDVVGEVIGYLIECALPYLFASTAVIIVALVILSWYNHRHSVDDDDRG